MANVHVVTESLACLPREADVNYAIRVVEHRVEGPGGPLSLAALLDRLADGRPEDLRGRRPVSADFAGVFRALLGWGVAIVSIHPPSAFGGCAKAAAEAAAAIGTDAPITIVRTGCAGPALGLVALAAAIAGDSEDREAVASFASEVAAGVRQVYVSTDPDHLARRGHDAPPGADDDAAHVCDLVDGRLRVVGSARPAADALRMAYERIGTGAGDTLHLALTSAGADAEAAALATVLGTRLMPAESWISKCDPALALELGRRSYAVAAWEGDAG